MIDFYRNFEDIKMTPDKIYTAEIDRVRDEAIVMKPFSFQVKPSIILIDKRCTLAKLTDLGVTERKGFDMNGSQRHITLLTTVLESSGKKAAGTRAYQALEIILGITTGASRDVEIYSYGVTSWECFSRKIPHYKKEDQVPTLAKHSTKLMYPFPMKVFLEDLDLSRGEKRSFQFGKEYIPIFVQIYSTITSTV